MKQTEKRMDDSDLRDLITIDAKALGLTYDEAIVRVRSGKVGSGYLWHDLGSLVRMLEAV